MQEKLPLTVYYDGTCNLCSAAIDAIDKSGKRDFFAPLPVSEQQLPPGSDMTGAMRDVHVVDEVGHVYKGIDAVLRILYEYPYWKPFVFVGRLPLIRHVLAILYRAVAATRYKIFGRK